MAKVSIEDLRQAHATLITALNLCQTANVELDIKLALRDSAIKRFEYTFEIGWKLIKRALDNFLSKANTDHMPRKDLFRKAYEVGLIENPAAWLDYTDARNDTVHGYDEIEAEKIFVRLPQFAEDAAYLLARLQQYL